MIALDEGLWITFDTIEQICDHVEEGAPFGGVPPYVRNKLSELWPVSNARTAMLALGGFTVNLKNIFLGDCRESGVNLFVHATGE